MTPAQERELKGILEDHQSALRDFISDLEHDAHEKGFKEGREDGLAEAGVDDE